MNLDWRYQKFATERPADVFWRSDFACEQAVIGRFASARPAQPAPVAASLFNVWWMPGKSFVVIYRLLMPGGQQEIETVRFFSKDQSKAEYLRAEGSSSDKNSISHLEDWHAVSWRFPQDIGLPELNKLIDMRHCCSLLGTGPEPRAAAQWSLLSYLPGERAAIRFTSAGNSFAGKIQKGAAQTHAAMQALWNAPQRLFGMAEPVVFDAATGARWERFLPGERFDLNDGVADQRTRIGLMLQGLGHLHKMQLDGLPENGSRTVMARIANKVTKRIRKSMPELAPAAAGIVDRLHQAECKLPARSAVTMHGDFHTANIIFDGDEPCFIDLDNLALGDAEYDLALFGTRLILSSLCHGGEPQVAGRLVESLPRIYADATGRRLNEAVFGWYIAALLVGRQVKTCIRHAAPHLEETSFQLLAWADAALEAGSFSADCLKSNSKWR